MMPLLVLAAALATGPGDAQDAALVRFAHETLAALQAQSFSDGREYCGTIGIAGDGQLVASRARRGRRDGCRPTALRGDARPLASYHTHAGFDPAADSELPSAQDLTSDFAEGIDGFVATPGGRLWFNDSAAGETRLICGTGCLPADPSFFNRDWDPVLARYDLDALLARLPQEQAPTRENDR